MKFGRKLEIWMKFWKKNGDCGQSKNDILEKIFIVSLSCWLHNTELVPTLKPV